MTERVRVEEPALASTDRCKLWDSKAEIAAFRKACRVGSKPLVVSLRERTKSVKDLVLRSKARVAPR